MSNNSIFKLKSKLSLTYGKFLIDLYGHMITLLLISHGAKIQFVACHIIVVTKLMHHCAKFVCKSWQWNKSAGQLKNFISIDTSKEKKTNVKVPLNTENNYQLTLEHIVAGMAVCFHAWFDEAF